MAAYLPYLLAAIVAVVMVQGWVKTWLDHRREEPLRRELMEQEVTFRARLWQVRVLGTGGLNGGTRLWFSLKGPMSILVRTGGFEVVSPASSLRLLFGMEYRFRAPEASIELSQAPSAPSRMFKRDWIVVSGKKAGRDVFIAITARHSLDSIWDALTGIGVHARV